jgi:hypothetical protein
MTINNTSRDILCYRRSDDLIHFSRLALYYRKTRWRTPEITRETSVIAVKTIYTLGTPGRKTSKTRNVFLIKYFLHLLKLDTQ